MSDTCRRCRELLAVVLVGHATDAERAAVDAHLAGCQACREEYDRLLPVAAALDAVDPEHVRPEAEPAPPALEQRILREVAAVQRRRTRRKLIRGGLAAAAVAALAILGFVVLTDQPPPDGVTLEVAGAPLQGQALVAERAWGTALAFELSGTDPSVDYHVWLERPDGSRVGAGSFRGVDVPVIEVDLASSLPRPDADAVGITADDGTELVRLPLP